jgi:AcrR family transcriptional regulator
VLNARVVDIASDGRVLRGERNRDAIADAMLSLYEDGVLTPSVNDVAERAGVSARSVHNHFVDVEGLRAEVAARQWARYAHLIEPPANGLSFDERIGLVVKCRSALFEVITPVRRAALLSVHESPTIARELARLGELLRSQLEATFAAELAHVDDTALDAVDLCMSWEAWDRLRTQQHLSPAKATRVLESMLRTVLCKGTKR